jgi:hypothetical protein
MEKRACERITMSVDIRFYCWNMFFWKKLCSGTIKNLSKNGMLIKTEKTFFPCDSQIEIFIPFKEDFLYIPDNLSRIVWRKKLSDNSFDGIGVELLEQPHNYLKFINRLKFNLKNRKQNISVRVSNGIS